ncbi:Pol polyprotein [Plakobranchus ocellatus]|uniref:Pol polyprotein n=1 Tax=Plakobranchus ocellatus TaxID=259542 RepID=A0AAV4DQT8_9GAST|nr:Pol polyprotein [Plakobranchus ocellatus]
MLTSLPRSSWKKTQVSRDLELSSHKNKPRGAKLSHTLVAAFALNEHKMENYSSFILELLGLKWAIIEKFRDYLLGGKYTVITVTNFFSHLQTAKLKDIKQNWAAELSCPA